MPMFPAWFPRRLKLLPVTLLFTFMLLPSLGPPHLAGAGSEPRITEYRVVRSAVKDAAGRLRLATRSFRSDGVPHLLVLDPVSLQSYDLPASELVDAGSVAEASLNKTPLARALDRYTAPPYRLQNQGATHADAQLPGVCLTVDLCPSRRPFERELFDTLAGASKGTPVPVAVAITGVWLMSHPEELAYLKRESAAGRLAITWVNHSYHHTYDPLVPLNRNFVLTPGTDFSAEVLELEQLLLSRGLVPSPFFRFPGLVSDAATVQRLKELSLIPIGSDAWLAKGETPKNGSFILVHGNGNEPKGIKLLLPMLRQGSLHLMPLPKAFSGQ